MNESFWTACALLAAAPAALAAGCYLAFRAAGVLLVDGRGCLASGLFWRGRPVFTAAGAFRFFRPLMDFESRIRGMAGKKAASVPEAAAEVEVELVVF